MAQAEQERSVMRTAETSRRWAGEKGCPDICSRFPEQGKSSARSSPSVSKSALIEGRGWQGERRSGFVPLSPPRAWTRVERIQQLGGDVEHPGKSASIRWLVTSPHFSCLVSLGWVKRKGAHA